MALVATFDLAENMITSVLSQVRRGVSLSRMDNTANSTRGVMVDLPDKIDFEINLLKYHQLLSRQTTSTETSLSADAESLASVDSELSRDSERSLDNSRSGGGSNEGNRSLSREVSFDSNRGGEGSLMRGGGSSSDSVSSSGTEDRSSNKNEKEIDSASSSSKENSNETNKDNSTRLDYECSDKWVTSETNRNYWKLDEDTGGVTQAS